MTLPRTELDPFDVREALRGPDLLSQFNSIGLLTSADVHVALRLADLGGEQDDAVALAAAFAVRAPRLGHVFVDLATIPDTASVDAEEPIDLSELPWPSTTTWIEQLSDSDLVAVGDDTVAPSHPLRLVNTRLYLDRYWREERQVAADLLAISGKEPAEVALDVLTDGLGRIFASETQGRQCIAAATAVLRRFAVIAGGPGTGKTTTVAQIVALLVEQAAHSGSPLPLVALAAPTGKAAARLEEAVQEEAAKLAVTEPIRAQVSALRASTLHRLLGWRPGSHSRFRHDRGQRLPHDVVIVDETSMVSLSLMARLVEAVRPDARLILVGDPGQLASIEAGSVLGDIVEPATDQLVLRADARTRLEAVTGREIAASEPPAETTIGDGIVVLDRVHRFGGGIATLAEAIRRGDADTVIDVLESAPENVSWIPVDTEDPSTESALAGVRDGTVAAARRVAEAARDGVATEAIAALGSYRLLCAHRHGPQGVTAWTSRVEAWLAAEIDGFSADRRWYVGRPLLVTRNDYELQLYNGDTGVVVQGAGDHVGAVFERHGEVIEFSPTRLDSVETVYAMTIHKSQGSQFETAAVLLPTPTSRILTRELLYTAATRARKQLVIVGTEETIRAAVDRPIARASGLGLRLWRTGQDQ